MAGSLTLQPNPLTRCLGSKRPVSLIDKRYYYLVQGLFLCYIPLVSITLRIIIATKRLGSLI